MNFVKHAPNWKVPAQRRAPAATLVGRRRPDALLDAPFETRFSLIDFVDGERMTGNAIGGSARAISRAKPEFMARVAADMIEIS